MKPKIEVFMSYASEDYEIAQKVYNDLKDAGIKPWMNEKDIKVGQNWKLAIRQAIKKSSYFIILLSSHSISKKGHVHKELKIALDILAEHPLSKIYILPIRLDNCEPLNEELQTLQSVDIFPSYEKGVNKILHSLISGNKEEESAMSLNSRRSRNQNKGQSTNHTSYPEDIQKPVSSGKAPIFKWSICLVFIALVFGVIITYCRIHPLSPEIDKYEIVILKKHAREKRERINLLFKKLEETVGPFDTFVPAKTPYDGWSSRPLAMAMVYDSQLSFSRQEKGNLVAGAIQSRIIDHSRVKLLERESFDTILEELIRAKSKPQFLMPELILILEINNADPHPIVLMRLDHTKKREIVSVLIEKLESGNILPQKARLSENLLKKLKQLYPLRGRILKIEQGKIILNIGDKTGVKMEQKFKVTGRDVILKVVSVQPDTCTAKVERGGIVLEKGWKTEEI